ncbi:MFS general substrate transporter [Melanomma pulvis-pyrius CBS 109.77]|uniref:MFS general substrate transporter n=1 Tax=Melanomma pulvis-pyrius CBS 109.77 TaxID=1314802 RepID=A0A6A6XVA2_9PLEO|nr:MFS general substrate transporter [Melanomma pulvis-pyrius CBS 109.77]
MSVPIPEYPTRDIEKGSQDLEETESIVHQAGDGSDVDSRRSSSHPEISRISSQPQPSRKSIGTKLTTVLTARSNASIRDPGPPPDSGFKAWLQAFMGHFVVFNTWGMISSFGVFQTYYTTELGLEPSAVSWIGSMQMFFHFFLGMFSGRALDGGLFHWVIIPGVLIASLGMFMTSLCTQYWQLFLAQGVLNGIGCGLQFSPAMSLVTTYFSKNRSLAVAIVASGSATGGLVYPTIARQLLPKLGFAWTVRIMAFVMLAVGACYCSLLKPRLPPRKTGPLLELSAFTELRYTLYVIGVYFVYAGQYFPFYYIGAYSVEVIGVPYSTSVNLLMIMNGVGLVGRLIPSYLADLKFGPQNTLIPFAFASTVVLYLWAEVKTEKGLYAWAIVYGVSSAGFQGLFPSALSSLTKDMNKVGVRNGMGFSIVGVASLTGPPIAGALIQRGGGSYLYAQMWGASMVFVGGVALVLGRASITGWKLRVRV